MIDLYIFSTAILIVIGSLGAITFIMLLLSIAALAAVGVPFVPTPQKNVKKNIDTLDLKPGEIFYDLGCGDGRFLIEAQKRGAKATGFEVSPSAFLRAKLNLLAKGGQAKLKYKNFYSQDLSDADAIFCFLLDAVMPKVEQKLLAELKPGARVVSYGFKMPNWTETKIIETDPTNLKSSKIYFYIK